MFLDFPNGWNKSTNILRTSKNDSHFRFSWRRNLRQQLSTLAVFITFISYGPERTSFLSSNRKKGLSEKRSSLAMAQRPFSCIQNRIDKSHFLLGSKIVFCTQIVFCETYFPNWIWFLVKSTNLDRWSSCKHMSLHALKIILPFLRCFSAFNQSSFPFFSFRKQSNLAAMLILTCHISSCNSGCMSFLYQKKRSDCRSQMITQWDRTFLREKYL